MYKIIGADDRQYGPVSKETICDWIANNRANGRTSALAEGDTEWKPLSAFPEFADALAAKPTPTPSWPALPAASPPPALDANAFAEEILQRDCGVDIGRCFSRAWEKLMSDFWPIVGISALVGLIIGAAGSIYVGIIVNGPLLGGLYWYYLKHWRGERPTLNDAFAGFALAFVQLMLAALVSGLLTFLGLLLCLLPGIYLAVAWCFALPLVIDKKLQFWDAMEVSRKIVTKQWWTFFVLILLTSLLTLAGLLACVVGVFVAWPLAGLTLMYAYEEIVGTPRSPVA